MDTGVKNFEISMKTQLFYGSGSINKLRDYLSSIGSRKVLVVCGPNFRKSESFVKVSNALGPMMAGVYDKVFSHPTFEVFYKGGKLAGEIGADTILSAGGGSSIDSGKGIALLRNLDVNLKEYLVEYDKEKGRSVKQFNGKPFRHVTVPTTFSSAETNGSAAVVDPETKRKYILWSDASLPSAAFLDPDLLESLPSAVAAASGMNTLAHCVETFYSADIQPVSSALTAGALELIASNIKKSTESPPDKDSRGMMLLASSMAGYAYGNAVVSLHHAICHVLGAYYNIPHGVANSIMLPYVMKFMTRFVPERIAEISRHIGLTEKNDTAHTAAEKATEWVSSVRDSLEVPRKLSDVGVKQSDLDTIAERTLQDWVAFQSVRGEVSREEVKEILESAL